MPIIPSLRQSIRSKFSILSFSIYFDSILYSEDIVRFCKKVFHTYRLSASESGLRTIGYICLLNGKGIRFPFILKTLDCMPELFLGVLNPVCSFNIPVFQFYENDCFLIKQAPITTVIHCTVRLQKFDTVIDRYKLHFYLIVVIYHSYPVLTLALCYICFLLRRRRVTNSKSSFTG